MESRQKLGDVTWPVYGPGSSDVMYHDWLYINHLASEEPQRSGWPFIHRSAPLTPISRGAGQAEVGQAPGRALEALVIISVCV